MNIPLKMNRDFEKAMAALNERYGEDFEFLNGFHETQLNFSDFIDGFIDKNVADVTIDANANASNKDIRSLLNEKGKSHDKLFAFNKIFYERRRDTTSARQKSGWKQNITVAFICMMPRLPPICRIVTPMTCPDWRPRDFSS